MRAAESTKTTQSAALASCIKSLIDAKLLTDEDAKLISDEQYDQSSLSHSFIFNLVLDKKISAKDALSLSFTDFQKTALSYPSIYLLVSEDKLSIESALSMSRTEIENPLDYSEEREDRNQIQSYRYQLYLSDSDISIYHAEFIIALQLKKNRSHLEERELELLLDPATRIYAEKIAQLEIIETLSEKDKRYLSLLYHFYARPYAKDIADLEFSNPKTEEEKNRHHEKLETLYLRICCKLPAPSKLASLLKAARGQSNTISAEPASCAFQFSHARNNRTDMHESDKRQMTHLKERIDQKIRTQLISAYFTMHKIPTALRNTQHLQNYSHEKISHLRFFILKYFADKRAPSFTDAAVDTVIQKIQEKLFAKKFRLGDQSTTLDFHDLLNSGSSQTTTVSEHTCTV